MRAGDLIARKRDGGALSLDELQWLMSGYAQGEIPDYQMAAWAMAVACRGMDLRETTDLTLAMAHSGTTLDLSDITPVAVDKHSTGGVGDKTTLLLAPLVAAIGLPVAKMSGRGLGFSGGTIDKLESIPGFRTDLSLDEFRRALRSVGIVVAAQTANLAPADKYLYALRDVTGTVESVPLIAASVMSKKLAAGATCIVLDVKYGSGAFVRTHEEARELARTMVGIGQRAGRHMTAVISSMEQPLGYAIGNALEVLEAIEALQEGSPRDLIQLCMEIGAQLALLAGTAPNHDAALHQLERALESGAAWEKFCDMVAQQDGDLDAIDQPDRLPHAPYVVPLPAPHTGYITSIDARTLGAALNELGGGRKHKTDVIDPAVGLVIRAKVGDPVRAGQPLLHMHVAHEADTARVAPILLAAISIGDTRRAPPPLIAEVITNDENQTSGG
jgi:pyrimidine-nucleoside phosphorylase